MTIPYIWLTFEYVSMYNNLLMIAFVLKLFCRPVYPQGISHIGAHVGGTRVEIMMGEKLEDNALSIPVSHPPYSLKA